MDYSTRKGEKVKGVRRDKKIEVIVLKILNKKGKD
jgi:hypothetical protein